MPSIFSLFEERHYCLQQSNRRQYTHDDPHNNSRAIRIFQCCLGWIGKSALAPLSISATERHSRNSRWLWNRAGAAQIFKKSPTDRFLARSVGRRYKSLCTTGLFVVDERISGAQNDKIIALETRLAPRFLPITPAFLERMREFKGTPYDVSIALSVEPVFVNQIAVGLELAGWDWKSYPEGNPRFVYGPAKQAIGLLGLVEGVHFEYDPDEGAAFKPAVDAMVSALKDANIEAFADPTKYEVSGGAKMPPNIIHINIGTKPLHE